MEQNKYFQPEISDIRVGYECEVNSSLGYSKEFTPTIVGFKNEDYAYTDEVSRLINMMDDGYGEIRTPYLTKEQIEAEGWTEVRDKLISCVGKTRCYLEIPFEKERYWVWFSEEDRSFAITGIDGIKTYFQGICPSINEFRTIIKLLNIK